MSEEDMKADIENLHRELDACSADLVAERDTKAREARLKINLKSPVDTFPTSKVPLGKLSSFGQVRAAAAQERLKGGGRRRRKSKKRKHTKKRKSKKKTRRRRRSRR